MKKLPIYILILLGFATTSMSQISTTVIGVNAIIGDTVHVQHIGYEDGFCGKVNGFIFGPYEGDFTIKYQNLSSPFKANIYFTPQKVGFFKQDFNVLVSYTHPTPPRGCPSQESSTITVYCRSYEDSSSITVPATKLINFQVNEAERQYEDSLSFKYRNNINDSVIIKSIKYVGEKADLIRNTLLNTSGFDSTLVIQPFDTSATINFLISSKEGPYEYTEYNREALLLIEKSIHGNIFVDTVFVGVIVNAPGDAASISISPLDILYTSPTGKSISFTDTVKLGSLIDSADFYAVEPASSAFHLDEVNKQPGRALLRFSFSPLIDGYQGVDYKFAYYVRLFDNSHRESSYQFHLGGEGISLKVENIKQSQFPSIYPNPGKNSVTISTKRYELHEIPISLHDILGNIAVLTTIYSANGTAQLTLDRKSLPSGLYYLSFVIDGQRYTEKLLLTD